MGVNYAPSTKVNVGADYGRETFNSLQESRNANPAPDPQWTDPNRNWTLTNDETVNTFSAYVDLVKALAKTDIRVAYDLQRFGPGVRARRAPHRLADGASRSSRSRT